MTVKFLLGVSLNATGALASHISLLANTLLSLTDSNPLGFATGSFEAKFELSSGGMLGPFLDPLLSNHEVEALLMEPQSEDASVLADFRDAPEMEEVSEAGEERPDEVSL